ncbi:hypothetical protein NKG05_20375 [Oerskovia sp. M15]
MIETLAIEGYRSLRHLVLPLGRITVVTGANGAGKSSLYRSLRLLAECALGGAVGALAREGGLPSTLWAGPEVIGRSVRAGEHPVQGTVRRGPVALRLGFASGPDPCPTAPRQPERPSPVTTATRSTWGCPRTAASRSASTRRSRPRSCGPDRCCARPPWSPTVGVRRSASAVTTAPGTWPGDGCARSTACSPRSWTPWVPRAPAGARAAALLPLLRPVPHRRPGPARGSHVGTRTPVLAHDGADLAAALETVRELGLADELDAAVEDAFRARPCGYA